MMNELPNNSSSTEVTATILLQSSKEAPQVSALVQVLRGVGRLAGQAADIKIRTVPDLKEESQDVDSIEQQQQAFLDQDIADLLREKIATAFGENCRDRSRGAMMDDGRDELA